MNAEQCHAVNCNELALVGKTRCPRHQQVMEENTRKAKERQRERVANGLCAKCATPTPFAPSSVVFCEKHLEEAKKMSQKGRDKRRGSGICHSCPMPAENGLQSCAKHAEKYRRASKFRQDKLISKGLCKYEGCGLPAVIGKKQCETHLAKRRQYEADKRSGLTASNQCYSCGSPTSDGKGRCEACKARNIESERALKAKRKADGLCIHCGGPGEQALRRKRLSCDKCRKRMNLYSAAPKNRFNRARLSTGSKKRGWTLTFEEYTALIAMPCNYCELPNTETYGTGLDRLENDRGYHLDNVVSCCPECNIVRNSIFTPEEMKLIGKVIREIKLTRLVKFRPNGIGPQ